MNREKSGHVAVVPIDRSGRVAGSIVDTGIIASSSSGAKAAARRAGYDPRGKIQFIHLPFFHPYTHGWVVDVRHSQRSNPAEGYGVTSSGKWIPDIDDPVYTTRHKARRWNRTVTVLDDIPALTKRSFPGWTKEDHLEAATAYADLRESYAAKHGQLLHSAYAKYGERGPYVAGVGQSHFPESVKEELRTLAHLASANSSAAAVHWRAARPRTPYHRSPLHPGRAFVYTK